MEVIWLVAVRRYLMASAVGYAAYSEYLNTAVRQVWAYTDMMPRLFGIGLLPLAQWVVVPILSLRWGCRRKPVA